MNNLKNNKKVIGAAVASLLLVGSIGGTVLASQNTDIVKKNVLMTEKTELNGSKTPIEKAIRENNGTDKINISAPVNEKQAVDIAKNALKNIFDVKIKDGEYSLQADYFDKSKNAQSYEGRSVWTVYWNKKQADNKKAAFEFHSTFIDAETGEILSMSSQKSNDIKVTEAMNNDAAKSMAKDFVLLKKLNNGSAIKEIQATSIPKKSIIEVQVKLDNGKGLTIVISGTTNRIIALQNHVNN